MRPRVPAWVVPAVITVAAGTLLLVRLGEPERIIFDEVYYVEEARGILDAGVERDFSVHPPVGKWLIAAGIALAGDAPAGWRFAGAVVGALTVLLTVLLTRRLTGRGSLAAFAGALLALDGLFVVQARTAMLDVHLVGFIVLGAYLLVVDRQRPPGSPWSSRWPLALAGVAFGAAVATKWSGLFALMAALGVVAVWEFAEQRRLRVSPAGAVPPAARAASRRKATAVTALVVVLGLAVPALVTYVLSWTPWVVQFERTRTAATVCAEQGSATACGFTATDRVTGLLRHHAEVARFHLDLDADHPYRAPATTWPFQARPVVFHWESCSTADDPATCSVAPGNAAEIIGLGNPVLWWGGLALLPVLVAGAVRRDRRSALPLAFLAAQYLPWLVVARPVFSFYAVPLVPFLAAAVAITCGELDRPLRWLSTLCGTALGAAGGAIVASLAGADPYGVATAALVAGLTGAAIGTAIDERRPIAPETAPRPPVGSYLGGGIALLALVAAVYFAPVWLALELPEETIRHRWWFSTWI